jgi:hypothetical protein
MTSRSFHQLAVPCTDLHVLRRERAHSRHSRIAASRLAFTRTVLTPLSGSAIRPILKLANSWQIRFLRVIPRKGKSANHLVFTGDEWWAWVDLNHRPRPYQGRALAT